MSLTDLASVGSLVNGIAVVISLLYLATQVRQSHRVSRAQIHQNIAGGWFNVTALVGAHASAFAAGVKSSEEEFAAMPDAEKLEFMVATLSLLKHLENAYLQRQEGFVRADDWEAWAKLMFLYFRTPGVRRYWKLRRDTFSPTFVRFVETSHESSLPLLTEILSGTGGTISPASREHAAGAQGRGS
jgi:hypothetical protein